ncbi:cytochrome P450 [Epithele typhae]|uniref:cytochrome P450 n=1 Tax=Epithele typhae TaxID=378194 RepID=UPI0020081C27|nr:cytochrome P450 [Epithele typhae]KAH9934038.1 cytochrome P450 [Epithele typhae]
MTSPPLIVAFTASVAFLVWRFARTVFAPGNSVEQLPGPPPQSWAKGMSNRNMGQIFHYNAWEYIRNLSETYGPICCVHSFFGTKAILNYDVKVMHAVYIKDKETWHRSRLGLQTGMACLGPGLLSTQGDTHRRQRKMLNSVFSAQYMRGLTPFFYEVAGKLESSMAARVNTGDEQLDVVGWMGRAALELIGQGALGHSFDPLVVDSKNAFTDTVKSFFPSMADIRYAFALLTMAGGARGPRWLRRLIVRAWPDPAVQRMRRHTEVMSEFGSRLIAEKRAAIERGDDALLHQIGEGKDVMSILLRENTAASAEDRLPDEELLAQISTFILAGVDTTSNALARVLEVLSLHPEAQERLRSEILEARTQYGREIPYDELNALPYLDAVCRETLRLYSPVTFSTREATKETVLPLSEPVNGLDHIVVPKGTMVITNIAACNTQKALWGEDAYEWNPDRWLKPLPVALDEARIPGIYANSFTFSGGAYSCIGLKFSQLEMKVVLSTLVAAFRFEPGTKKYVWNLAVVAYPAAHVGDKDPEMMLKVNPVKVS